MTTENLVTLFGFVLPVLVSIATILIKDYLASLPADKRSQLTDIVTQAVTAIEQTQEFVPGPNKKVQAEALIASLLKRAGLKADPTLIDTLIETAVFNLQAKQMTAPTVRVAAVQK